MSKKLQSLIDRVARNGARYYDAQSELMDYCRMFYGFEPGDVDADSIIDRLLGGCGKPSTMPAKEFDDIMREHVSP